MKLYANHHFIIPCILIVSLTACSQANSVEKTTKNNKTEHIEINLDNYIPEKSKLTQLHSISDHPHEGTLKSTSKPSFPPRAEKSGHCYYVLKISESGDVAAIDRLDCSDDIFVKHTKQKLLQWVYYPKKDESGENIAFTVGPLKISYRLTDLDGNIIPE